ncbi:hypothetical protein AB205_0102550 [Aquarana catesbeiana]|uniref:BESS domain-containing protein n=1 Tax=Aquarana catesbeiana TaxID=8400 RepID=A0A2G9SAL7_AQUCT|nr:hypothetical protein AB205_0102550 [Aquarana catesbeiana]
MTYGQLIKNDFLNLVLSLYFAVHSLQTRWRSLKDLRKLKEGRSGSGSKRLAPYAHAGDLDFLKPVLEMRETQASWEDSTQGLAPEDESEEAAAEEEQEQFQDNVDKELFVDESRSATNSMNEEDAEPGPSNVSRPLQISSRGSARAGKPMDKILDVVSQMSTKVVENQYEDTAFLTVILGICKQVPPEKKYALRMALMSTAQSFVGEEPTTSSACMQPPQYPPYQQYPHFQSTQYAPPINRPYCDQYGNMLNPSRPRMLHPIPAPTTSTLGPPTTHQLRQPTPSQVPPFLERKYYLRPSVDLPGPTNSSVSRTTETKTYRQL